MKVLVLDLHTDVDLTEGPKISKVLEQYVETSTVKVLSPYFSLEKLESMSYEGIVLTGFDDPLLLRRAIAREIGSYLREITHKVYILGICGGCELLARADGYEISYLSLEEREIGWPVVHLTERGKVDPLFRGFPESFRPFEYHNKAVSGVGESKILAKSDKFLQAFLFEEHRYGVQFHPEDSPETGAEYLESNIEKLSKYFDVSTIVASRPKEYVEWKIFRNFVDILKQKT